MTNHWELAPLIWFEGEDSSISKSLINKDCNCDCACANLNLSNSNFRSSETFGDKRYQQSKDLVLKKDGNYWMVANPTTLGHIAVLNSDAFKILESFNTPISFYQLEESDQLKSTKTIQKTSEMLFKMGFLVEANSVEHPPIWTNPSTLTGWLHFSNSCNLSCDYCYVNKNDSFMSLEIGKQAINSLIHTAVKNGFTRVKLKYAGGEPSLFLKQLFAIHDYASERASKFNIHLDAVMLSNGIHIPDWAIREFIRREINIMISLDGIGKNNDIQRFFKNKKGTFSFIERTIDTLSANGIQPYITITVSNRNLDGLPEVVKYLLVKDLPFNINFYRKTTSQPHDLELDPLRIVQVMKDVFKIIENQMPSYSFTSCILDRADLRNIHRFSCGVCNNYVVIDHDGNVAKCQMDIKAPVTTVQENDLISAIKGDQTGIKNISVDEKKVCNVCLWRYWCAGGCALLAEKSGNHSGGRSPNCYIYQELIPDVLRLEALRLLKHITPWTPTIERC